MSEALNLDLNKNQCDLLLLGLKYIRSSILLEFRVPTAEDTEHREKELRELSLLVDQLNGSKTAKVTAGV